MQRKGRLAVLAALLLSAPWPRFVDVDDLPDTELAREYREEALMTLSWMRDNPVQRAIDVLLVQRWRFYDWREVPGSGEGSTSLPAAMDVQVEAMALGPWGIPLSCYTIGCGGACSQLR